MAVVTARRGWRVTLRWRIVVRPLSFVFAAVVAAAIAAVIAAVIAVPLFRRSRWLLCASLAF
jgi:ABC-type branched-subunit amino acid transport system permease subunit